MCWFYVSDVCIMQYLFPSLTQQCAYCCYCKFNLQTRTQEFLCPLKGGIITHTLTTYQHYYCTKELFGKPFNHLQAALETLPLLSLAVQLIRMLALYDNIRQKHEPPPVHNSVHSYSIGLTEESGICVTILMHMN